MEIVTTEDFAKWFHRLTHREQAQINARLARIEAFGHLGDWKYLGDSIAELRWKNGRRIYFSKIGNKIILLLSGGLKNAQKKDIQKARIILRRYASR